MLIVIDAVGAELSSNEKERGSVGVSERFLLLQRLFFGWEA